MPAAPLRPLALALAALICLACSRVRVVVDVRRGESGRLRVKHCWIEHGPSVLPHDIEPSECAWSELPPAD